MRKCKKYEPGKGILWLVSYSINRDYALEFDIGITDGGFKLMEINPHPGLGPQIFHPLLENDVVKTYFKDKLNTINEFSDTQRIARNNLPR